jgi:hypothetical protein
MIQRIRYLEWILIFNFRNYMKEIWMRHHSAYQWNDAEKWNKYLRGVEEILGDLLVKLDVSDPIRRRSDKVHGDGEFIVQFKAREDSRWLFGIFEKTGIKVQIRHFKNLVNWENTILFTVPNSTSDGVDSQKLFDLFKLTSIQLNAFYAYSDFKDIICAKKPSTPSLDISRELLGVFWLTYFGSPYCNYFGRERLLGLEQAIEIPDIGIILRLAETPNQASEKDRYGLEHKIAPKSFAGINESKSRGQYALSLQQLANTTTKNEHKNGVVI